MSIVLLPDVEALLSAFLRDQDEIEALVGDRVYTAVPKDPTFPLLLVKRVSGSPRLSRPRVIDAPLVQFDAYGGSKKQAHTLIQTALAVIAARVEGAHDLGVVSGCEFGPVSWLPDPSYTPAQARYIGDVTLTIHP